MATEREITPENATVVVRLLENAVASGGISEDFAATVFESWLEKQANTPNHDTLVVEKTASGSGSDTSNAMRSVINSTSLDNRKPSPTRKYKRSSRRLKNKNDKTWVTRMFGALCSCTKADNENFDPDVSSVNSESSKCSSRPLPVPPTPRLEVNSLSLPHIPSTTEQHVYQIYAHSDPIRCHETNVYDNPDSIYDQIVSLNFRRPDADVHSEDNDRHLGVCPESRRTV